ncbi:uncharacterized protein LOC135427666 [Drosophila montana]|uniref:uncharacterized protein LOC135427666 n=1 Tax=Drosophila montana TaxID=40370 RepID=UPI00313A8491
MPLTAGTVARSDSCEWLPPALPAGGRCATVTMLLARRIARGSDCWSVDAEPRYRANKMNVWQTLEYLSGLGLRKRYNYEGFADTQHLIRTLTPSWRRDSFAERSKAEDAAAAAASGAGNAKYVDERGIGSVADVVSATMARCIPSFQSNDNLALSLQGVASIAAAPRRKRHSRRKSPVLDAEYALSQDDLQDLVKCT